jgi:hypothetical protein
LIPPLVTAAHKPAPWLTSVFRRVGLPEAAEEPSFDEQAIWSSEIYPSRVKVRVELALAPEQGFRCWRCARSSRSSEGGQQVPGRPHGRAHVRLVMTIAQPSAARILRTLWSSMHLL